MKYGEIVELGRHKLMCGDATSRDDVMRLVGGEHVDMVLTDPPYGMRVLDSKGMHSKKYKPTTLRREVFIQGATYPALIGDDTSDTAHKHYAIVKDMCKRQIIWGGQYFADFLPVNGGWLFWDKRTGNNDFSDGELAYCSEGKRVRKYTQLWNGVCMAGSYALNARKDKARIHPTQKPVELHMRILEDFTQPDDVILDCFGGSGTTLIACEMTGRKCLMMEISSEYCDIIRERYEKLTSGKLPLEATNDRGQRVSASGKGAEVVCEECGRVAKTDGRSVIAP